MRHLLIFLAALLLAACTAASPPELTPPSPTAGPTGHPPPLPRTGVWAPIAAGLESLETADGIVALRHPPDGVRYEAVFEPSPHLSRQVSVWLEQDARALAAVNCGFYRADNDRLYHIGLLTTNGTLLSELRARWGAVLIVRDGRAFVARRPKKLLAPATLGIQGWPTLVQNAAKVRGLDDRNPARRTAVGVDRKGRVVWVASIQAISLDAFAARLLEKDLRIVDAINLDGGVSTGLRWRVHQVAPQSGPNSLPVPCVIRLGPTS